MDMAMRDTAGAKPGQRPGPTRQLADFTAQLTLAEVDEFARNAARRHSIDTIAAMITGATQDATLSVERALAAAGTGPGTIASPGVSRRYDVLSAAYIGGTSGHGLELDDGYRAGSVHPGGVVLPVALTLGAQRHVTGAAFLTSVVAGYEAACRIAAAAHPRARWRGFHNTGTVGTFAGAAVGAVLLGFDADATENAFGVAASSSAGLFSFLAGGDVKRTHPGHAAREGVWAALMTEAGLPAPRGVLEFREGFFNAYAGGDVDYAALDLLSTGDNHPSSRFAVANCYMKPHACCRHIHSSIDAVLDMAATEALAPDDIARIDIGSYAIATTHGSIGWTEMTTAQMSVPFVIATALLRGRVGLADFGTAQRADPAVHALAALVHSHTDADCDTDYPRIRAAKVKVTLRNGRTFDRYVPEPYGAASKPLSDEALDTKFLDLASPRLGDARARTALAMLWQVDSLPDIAPLAEALAGP